MIMNKDSSMKYALPLLALALTAQACAPTFMRKPETGAYMGDPNSAKAAQCVPYGTGQKNPFAGRTAREAALFITQCDLSFTNDELRGLKAQAEAAGTLKQ